MSILKQLKEMQKAKNKNRLVMVLDGMGVSTINGLLNKKGFFCRNMTGTEKAIIPATTVAATTAYRTGKMPCETGFIGWCQYFSEVDEVIEIFTNRNFYSYEISKMTYHTNTLPCKTVVEEMMDNNRPAFEIMPAFVPGGFETFDKWLKQIVKVCNQENDAYIYAYWNEPDSTLHELGSKNPAAKKLLRNMEEKIENALNKIHNKTDVLITADHGHIDTDNLFISDYPDLAKCFSSPSSLEARCVSCFIKPEYKKEFPVLFNKYFGKDFKLVSKSEFEKKYLSSDKQIRFIGDFVAIATGKYNLWENHDCVICKSNHAGITKDETEIPVIKLSIIQKDEHSH